MMNKQKLFVYCSVFATLGSLVLLPACFQSKKEAPEKPLPNVIVVPAVSDDYIVTATEIGQVESNNSVELMARVEGYLTSVNFKEGELVKAGTVLFTIDPTQYEATVKQAQGQLYRAKADLANARVEFERQKTLLAQNATSKKDYDSAEAKKNECEAVQLTTEASLALAQLDLSYTKILAPFDGWIGFKKYAVGNLVGKDGKTQLATIEEAGIAKVNFNMSELDVNALSKNAKAHGRKPSDAQVDLFDQNQVKIDLSGSLYAWDNRINSSTGTLKLQALFQDPTRILLPGSYVRVRVHLSEPTKRIMIRESAITEDVTGSFVMLVTNPKGDVGKVERRYLKILGRFDGSVSVKEGLSEGELVIVSGLQRVRQGQDCRFTKEGSSPEADAAPKVDQSQIKIPAVAPGTTPMVAPVAAPVVLPAVAPSVVMPSDSGSAAFPQSSSETKTGAAQ